MDTSDPGLSPCILSESSASGTTKTGGVPVESAAFLSTGPDGLTFQIRRPRELVENMVYSRKPPPAEDEGTVFDVKM